MDMNDDQRQWLEQTERRHQLIACLLDEIRSCAIAISDDERLLEDRRPFRTQLQMAYMYRDTRVEVVVNVVWMPLTGWYEVNLTTQYDFEIVRYEISPWPIFEVLGWISDNVVDREGAGQDEQPTYP